jgi:predicted adenine nucleotide alpha hydrolase (AANH) superfamily ATPase
MTDLLLHACCGPCSTVSVPAWRERGVEPVAWFENPNIQPAAELERRREGMRRYGRAAALDLIEQKSGEEAPEWGAWREGLAAATPGERCAVCLGLRLDAAGAAARDLGFSRFSTTLTVSPYQRHDLIIAAGETAADAHGVDFVYLDARDRFRDSYAECRRLDLYRQPYCGCAASKWEAWHERRERRRRSA